MSDADELRFLRLVVGELVWWSRQDRMASGMDYRDIHHLTDDELDVLDALPRRDSFNDPAPPGLEGRV